MHPSIRVVSFLVFAAFLSLGGSAALLPAAVLVLLLYARRAAAAYLAEALPLLRRVRWLLLSMLVVYAWYTPGNAVVSAAGAWSPTWSGIGAGGERVAALVLLVLAVNYLLQSTPRERLLDALHWLLSPLALAGVSADRVAVRLLLVFEAVTRLRPAMSAGLRTIERRGNPLRMLGDAAAHLFNNALEEGRRAALHPVTLSMQGRPPDSHWLFPVLLAGVFLAAPYGGRWAAGFIA